MDIFIHDLRYALRQLRKSPGFSAIAMLTLAIGIGASTAIFSIVDTVLLRPLPYSRPDQLVLVTESLPKLGMEEIGVSAGEYQDYRRENRCFSHVAAFEGSYMGRSMVGFNLTGAGAPLRVNGANLSASVFAVLGVSPELGRPFTPEEDRYGAGKVVILSHTLWVSAYGRDPNVLGKAVKLDEQPYTVVGVMPASFHFPFDDAPLSERADLWVPEAFDPALLTPDNRTMEFGIGLVARLKPGVTLQQAQQDVQSVANGFMQRYGYSGNVVVAPRVYAYAPHVTEKARPLLLLLTLAVACVLLVACANVSNMLLARASRRYQEMAIRTAVGASRTRVLLQCLIESALLSLGGAMAGILLAEFLVLGFARFGPADVPRLHDVTLHPVALVFTLVVSLLSAFAFGLVPAWRLSRAAPVVALRESTQAGHGHSTQRLQHSVTICEIAAALVLLICGGLLIKSFIRVLHTPLGFDPNGAIVVRTIFDHVRYHDPAKRMAVQKELLQSLRSLPGVTAVAAATHVPLRDSRQIGFRLEHAEPGDVHWAENSLITPGYFRTMGIPLQRGRDFSEYDDPKASVTALINETMARKYFPGQDAVGQRFHWGDKGLFTIIGVVEDVHISALDADPPPMIYTSMFQVESGASGRMAVILRNNNAGQAIFDDVQRRIWSVDKDLPVYQSSSLAALVSESLAQRRFTVFLLGAFAGIGLLLAAIGLFGVVSFLVADRTREFGVRMALGANRGTIYLQVLRRAATLSLYGCAIGIGLSLLASRALQSSLYQVNRFDPETMVLVPLLLIVVELAAAYWPARRAANIDPMQALRYE
jgi:predicted permease